MFSNFSTVIDPGNLVIFGIPGVLIVMAVVGICDYYLGQNETWKKWKTTITGFLYIVVYLISANLPKLINFEQYIVQVLISILLFATVIGVVPEAFKKASIKVERAIINARKKGSSITDGRG